MDDERGQYASKNLAIFTIKYIGLHVVGDDGTMNRDFIGLDP